MNSTELLPQEEKDPDKKHLSNNVVDLQSIKSIIEKDFQNAIKNRNFGNESHLREDLTDFLKLVIPADVKIGKEVRTKLGIVDILIDKNYILELKYADNRGTLDRGIAEVVRYKKLGNPVIMVILDIGILSPKIITQYRDYYEDNGAEAIVIKATGHRERVDTVTSFVKNLMRGKKFVTVEQIIRNYSGKKKVLHTALSRLEKRGLIERIEKGKYMIIPLGAEKGKYTLNEFVIGAILVKPYCISYWSALHFYGLTEQIPNTVFIQTTARKKRREIEVFGVKYRITRIKDTKFFGIRKEWIEEAQINITDREKTIVDCLDKPHYCGGIVEVAKALKNGKLDMEKISAYAQQIGNSGVIRRLGYLCDFLGIDISVSLVETRNYLLLDPTMVHKGPKNSKWKLIINLDEKILGKLE